MALDITRPFSDRTEELIGAFERDFDMTVEVVSEEDFGDEFKNDASAARCRPYESRDRYRIILSPEFAYEENVPHELAHGVLAYRHEHGQVFISNDRPDIVAGCRILCNVVQDWFVEILLGEWGVEKEWDDCSKFPEIALRRLRTGTFPNDVPELKSSVYGVCFEMVKSRCPSGHEEEFRSRRQEYMRLLKERSPASHTLCRKIHSVLRPFRRVVNGRSFVTTVERVEKLVGYRRGKDYTILTPREVWDRQEREEAGEES